MIETTMGTNHINTLKTPFSKLTMLSHKIEEIERAELYFKAYLTYMINLSLI